MIRQKQPQPLNTPGPRTARDWVTVGKQVWDEMDVQVFRSTDSKLIEYKVPSLKGVWYRGLLSHDGSVATLEDWFDPARLREDYSPTGFKGYKVHQRAVPGHEFGLNLSTSDKAALIAFLRTL
jgi:hypothetical protein